jgi:hypothetical protein
MKRARDRWKFAGIAIALRADMDPTHLPRTCKWSSPTLLLPFPLWLEAWTHDWSCARDGTFRPLPHPDCCRTCPRWESQSTVESPQSLVDRHESTVDSW